MEETQVPTPAQEDSGSPQSPKVMPHDGGGAWDKKKIVMLVTILIAIIVPVAAYFVYNRAQTTTSDARTSPQCLVKVKPVSGRTCPRREDLARDASCGPMLPLVLVKCSDDSFWCTEQGSTFDVCGDMSKKIRDCTLKSRRDSGGEYFEHECLEATPTPPQQICPKPNECVDANTAKMRGCTISSTNTSQRCSLGNASVADGYCCPPAQEQCPAPNQCIPASAENLERCGIDPTNVTNVQKCTVGGGAGVCCVPKDVTPSPTPTDRPTPTPTVTPPPDETPTATPPITQACIYPKVDVEVECAVCGGS